MSEHNKSLHNQPSLLPDPLTQLMTIKMLNELCGWEISESKFEYYSRPINIPSNRGLKQTQAVLLDIGLRTFEATFETTWSLIKKSQLNISDNITDRFDLDCPDKNFNHGFAWQIVDFGANTKGESVKSVRAKDGPLPTSAIFWALIYNPGLFKQLQHFDIDAIWLGGCQIKKESPNVPILKYDYLSEMVEFRTGHSENEWSNRSIPEFVRA